MDITSMPHTARLANSAMRTASRMHTLNVMFGRWSVNNVSPVYGQHIRSTTMYAHGFVTTDSWSRDEVIIPIQRK